MAKLMKSRKHKIAPLPKAVEEGKKIVLVGTYKEKQLAWIKKHGVYNYPVNEEDEFNPESCAKTKELWLYASARGKRFCFAAEFVGIQSKNEFLAANPTYKNLGPSKHTKYMVFKASAFDYGPRLVGATVFARVSDFEKGRGRTKKIAAAIKQFHDNGDFGLLADYLPSDLAKLPREQLRVCETGVQLEFDFYPAVSFSIENVAKRTGLSVKIVRRLVASGVLKAERSGTHYLISSQVLEEYEAALSKQSSARLHEVHFIDGRGIDPEQRDMIRRGKTVGKGLCVSVSGARTMRKARLKSDVVNWCDISAHWENPGRSRSMTFVDLFCGAGGLSKGLEMAGLEGICGLDWFDEAGQTYACNFDHPFVNGDIKLPENKQRFYEVVHERLRGRHLSLVAGGFPCQGFSMAGNRIVDDPRNSLYKELVEIVETLKPDFVLCENVKGLRSILGGAVEEKIINDFRAIGYNMNVTTLCAADYYVPQKRERVIFIGNCIGIENLHPKPMLQPQDYVLCNYGYSHRRFDGSPGRSRVQSYTDAP